jgi:hypothetical protein
MREGALDDSFAALVRGPSTRYPRGFALLFPVWVAAIFAAAWVAWLRVIGPMPWWYAGTLTGGLLIAGITASAVLATIRQPAFRADRNGIRLGLRTERKRPRNRQAHLWWSDVRQLRIEPRHYGLMVEISLGPAARIVRRRGPLRQVLLWSTMLIMPFGLGRGTPRLTEPRRKDPQYRVRLYDVTPEELGLALAGLALPAVEIIVISRRYGPIMARRPQPAAPRRPAPAAAPSAAAAPPAPTAAPPTATSQPAAAPPVTSAPVTAPPVRPSPVDAPTVTLPPVMAQTEAVAAETPPPPTLVSPVADEPLAADEPLVPNDTAAASEAPAEDEPLVPDDTAATGETPAADEPLVPDDTAAISEAPAEDEPLMLDYPAATGETPAADEPLVPDDTAAISETPAEDEPLMLDYPAAAGETPAADELTGEAPGADVLPPDVLPPDDVASDGPLAGVPVMAAPHAGLEVAAPAERAASQPAA